MKVYFRLFLALMVMLPFGLTLKAPLAPGKCRSR